MIHNKKIWFILTIMTYAVAEICIISFYSPPENKKSAANINISMNTDSQEKTLEYVRSKRILWRMPYPKKELDEKVLTAVNKNYIGWLSFHFAVPDTRYDIHIEEPVPFETKQDYYLHHNFYKETNKNGCIFMDFQSNSSLYGYNDFLYAHHAADGSLFGTLNRIYEFDDHYYLTKNPQYLYIYTKTACHKYIMMGYERIQNSNNNYTYTTCDNEKMYYEYMNYIKSLPNFIDSKEINWDCNPELMNFSTCDGPAGTSQRFIVHFAKITAYAY